MDPLSIAASVGGLIALSTRLSSSLYALVDGSDSGSREFEVFSQEIGTFGLVWDLIRPRLEDPDIVLSQAALENLEMILATTERTLIDLERSLDTFAKGHATSEKVTTLGLFPCMVRSDNHRRGRLQKFMRQDRTKLYRSQIHYATSVLNILLAIIEYRRCFRALGTGELTLFQPKSVHCSSKRELLVSRSTSRQSAITVH